MDEMKNNFDQEKRKEFSRRMSICMGIIMSLCLSTAGLLTARAFSLPSLLLNLVISYAIVRGIDHFIDIGALAVDVPNKMDVDPNSLQGRFLRALITDVIYTPLMTIVMVSIGYYRATSHGAQIPYVPMLMKSMLLTFTLSFLICFFIMPVVEKLILKGLEDKK
ncbi:MAG: hypothetical protein J6Z03_07105 [Erysipelotrichaceae bacterium]|nr:hypothetical protein [Erysipelotrichaceae bacterium]